MQIQGPSDSEAAKRGAHGSQVHHQHAGQHASAAGRTKASSSAAVASHASGVRASFSPEGLKMAGGIEKVGAGAELAAQGLGQIGAAASESVGEALAVGGERLGDALHRAISAAGAAATLGQG